MTPASLWPSNTGSIARLLLALSFLSLTACGGGGSSDVAETPPADTVTCNPDDATTADECGVLYLAVTDADGDFVSYTVDVVSLSLERANGAVVQTLPNTSRIDFTNYVELTEFVSARNVPPGVYVSGTITLDYSNADIMVEKDGVAVPALVTDADGAPLTTLTLDIMLAEQDQLTLRRGVASLLVVDFDLGASHTVDVTADPVTAIAEPIIVADVEPIDEKDVRVRGPLVDVDVAGSTYTVQLRPFYRRDGDFGIVDVIVDDATIYEIDGDEFAGAAGLEALSLLDSGSPTRAIGTLDVAARTFTAAEVLAGTSVPGTDLDAVRGHVTSRNGNTLTVLGATVIPSDRERYFNDTVTVTISDATKVFVSGDRGTALTTDAISVGQRVLIRGAVTDTASDALALDASNGSVRLLRTRVSGSVVVANPGQIDLDLVSIGGRNPERFDFSGTGTGPDTDADPTNYEIATGVFDLSDFAAGAPAVAYGNVNEFGFAPPDFVGRTLVDINELRAVLGIGWTAEGSTAPFLAIGPDGLVPDPEAYAEDARQTIKIGPRLLMLSEIEGGITITGSDARRTLYGLRDGDSLELYRNFADFADAVAETLDGSTAARSLSAQGSYIPETQTFSAHTIWLTFVRD
ncbi:MAG: hypothetical protein AAFZ58_09410 [Pseudomonadota bacterium]